MSEIQDDIERVGIDELAPYPNNPKEHPDEQIDKLVGSIKEYGFVQPLVVNEESQVIIGHGRLKAAKRIGMDEVPAIDASHLTDAQQKALRLADNRMSETGWDMEALGTEFEGLDEMGFDIDYTGFDDQEVEEAVNFESEPDEVEEVGTPELPEDARTNIGDLWILGEHRLLCGDATDEKDVHKLLDEGIKEAGQPNLMITDPPYGVEYDPTHRSDNRTDTVHNDDRMDWSEAFLMFPGDVIYLWHNVLNAARASRSLTEAGFETYSQIIWSKNQLVFSRGHYHWKHEPCYYAVRKGESASWIGDDSQTTVWEVENIHPANEGGEGDEETTHSAQKPVECMARPIRNHSGAVYDPFLGSGSTLIAAEQFGRKFYGMELDPRYCDVIVERWEDYTGKEANRERS